jgi:hypothetical protein
MEIWVKDRKTCKKIKTISLNKAYKKYSLISFLHKHSIQIEFEHWLVFSRGEEELLERSAKKFLPASGVRAATFLNLILNRFRQDNIRKINTCYIPAEYKMPAKDGKEMFLAIHFAAE